MSKTLKGTYLWNEVINPPSQDFNIEFAQDVKTNYGISSVTSLRVDKQDPTYITYGFQNGKTNVVYEKIYGTGWIHGGYRTMTFGNGTSEETVSDEFYTWFTANSVSLEDTVELTGTYRWNDTVLGPDGAQDWIEEEQNYVYNYDALPVGGLVFYENINASATTSGLKVQAIQVVASQQGQTTRFGRPRPTYHIDMLYVDTDIGGTGIDSFRTYEGYTNKQGAHDYFGTWQGKGNRTITFNPGTTVSSIFYSWLMINAQGVELCELSGRWKWTDIPANHTRDFDKVKINFKSGFTNMKYMLIEPNVVIPDISYISPKFTHKVTSLSNPWPERMYKIVDFSDEVQEVTKEFYDWFTANATKQTLVEISGVWNFNSVISDPYDLTGAWRWKDIVSPPNKGFVAEFTNVQMHGVDGETLRRLKVSLATSSNGEYCDIWYVDDVGQVYEGDDGDGNAVWVNEEDRVLIFDEKASVTIVDDDITYGEFCEWFSANAERIGNEVDTDRDLGIYEPVSFKTYVNNKEYLGMSVRTGNDDIARYMRLHYCTYAELSEVVDHNQIYYRNSAENIWTHESTNRTIDFGDTPKLVSTEFYEWFTANAVEASYEISGTWMFKERVSTQSKEDVSEFTGESVIISGTRWFISHGREHSQLSVDCNNGLTIKYDDTLVFTNGVWVNDYYRTISIVGSMKVPESFYRWFMYNVERDQLLIERSTLIDIGNAIRAKTGKTDPIKVSELANEIAKITTASNGIVSVSIREIQ